ncbi:uncharacterized protein J8A68_000982 [[Candida] subhashii]|uniref:CFEM domain-containing protein n=1 Tax=[Candida] subhashii TaxID=561895 RepID=A0A8J5QTG4_9ASCO|nr:uncharacterized protein J8A68_000982 [[Candida] subhashii]KAG7665580.1 hypothetical protein J8A68_000982 [[Candida] subhashii]
MKSTQFLSTFLLSAGFALAADEEEENPYATYPSVARTATINGFADPVYDSLPSCAQPCVDQNTGLTPCPYWDTGCLCIMPQFANLIGNCIAESCKGNDVAVATEAATAVCAAAGVWDPYWFVGDSVKEALAAAAAVEAETTVEAPSTTTEPQASTPEETAAPESTADAPEPSPEAPEPSPEAPEPSPEAPEQPTESSAEEPQPTVPSSAEESQASTAAEEEPEASEEPASVSIAPPLNETEISSLLNGANHHAGGFVAAVAGLAGVVAALI